MCAELATEAIAAVDLLKDTIGVFPENRPITSFTAAKEGHRRQEIAAALQHVKSGLQGYFRVRIEDHGASFTAILHMSASNADSVDDVTMLVDIAECKRE
jgi:hypothetical protein